VALFDSMHLHRLVGGYLVGIGFRSGEEAAVTADKNPCGTATGPIGRTIFFEAGGRWGGRIGTEQVDDGTMSDLRETSFAVPGDSPAPAITIDYAIDGDTITFTVESPDPCSEPACAEQLAWARETFGLGPWQRM
jgi:hypothetical protein